MVHWRALEKTVDNASLDLHIKESESVDRFSQRFKFGAGLCFAAEMVFGWLQLTAAWNLCEDSSCFFPLVVVFCIQVTIVGV